MDSLVKEGIIPLKGCGEGGVNLFSAGSSDRSMGKAIRKHSKS